MSWNCLPTMHVTAYRKNLLGSSSEFCQIANYQLVRPLETGKSASFCLVRFVPCVASSLGYSGANFVVVLWERVWTILAA